MKGRHFKSSVQTGLAEQQKQDEEKHLKAMQERARLDYERELRDHNTKMQASLLAKETLSRQIEERRSQVYRARDADANYALGVRRDVEEQEMLERKKREKYRVDRQKYREVLEKQIEDRNRRKLFRDVMSDHERKVNSLDLDAYQKMDLHLHAKIVGAKDIEEVSHNTGANSLPMKETSTSPSYELAKKVNMADSVMRRGNAHSSSLAYGASSRIVKAALENMLYPRVRYMRNNTQNRIYGYDGEGYFSLSATNKSLVVSPTGLERGAGKCNSLSNAGRSQLADPIAVNLPQKAAGKHEEQRETSRSYVNYNIITGASS